MTKYNLIKEAILKRQSITCFYHGYMRKMTPHILGLKNDKEQALFYQYGESSSGLSSDPTRNWRCISIEEIEQLDINNDQFQTVENYSDSTCINTIDVKV